MNVLGLRAIREIRSSRCPAAHSVILCSGFRWNFHLHPQKAEIIISRESLANVVRSMVYLDIGTDPVIIGGPRTFQCGGRVRRFYLNNEYQLPLTLKDSMGVANQDRRVGGMNRARDELSADIFSPNNDADQTRIGGGRAPAAMEDIFLSFAKTRP